MSPYLLFLPIPLSFDGIVAQLQKMSRKYIFKKDFSDFYGITHCIMKTQKYPTITVRVSPKHRQMADELKNHYYLNISKIFRDTIESIYLRMKNESK